MVGRRQAALREAPGRHETRREAPEFSEARGGRAPSGRRSARVTGQGTKEEDEETGLRVDFSVYDCGFEPLFNLDVAKRIIIF